MLVSVEVSDDIAQSLRLDGPQPSRRVLESLALEGYRSCELSRRQVGEMLGMGFYETEAFLKMHSAYVPMTDDELDQERQALRSVLE